jgi:hypothetical protein
VAPFDAAALVLLLGGALVAATWGENYGDGGSGGGGGGGLAAQFKGAWEAIRQGEGALCREEGGAAGVGVGGSRAVGSAWCMKEGYRSCLWPQLGGWTGGGGGGGLPLLFRMTLTPD